MSSEELQKAREYEAAQEPLVPAEERPVFHVTARAGWLNDPNGFSVYRGEYHLFYQYYPYSSHWGPMHWGHSKTKDFVRWERLPAALAPDRDYDRDGCWSGGAAELPDGRQLLMYTGRHIREEDEKAYQVQCLAVGDGLNYEKYAGNPVLREEHLPDGCSPFDFRDPKLWRGPDGMFYAVTVTLTENDGGAALLYSSPDGFDWRFRSVLARSGDKDGQRDRNGKRDRDGQQDGQRSQYGKMWECPDFFTLDGRQVLSVSPMAMQPISPEFHAGYTAICFLGRFDPDSGAFSYDSVQTIDHGMDFYAAQTLESMDGRRIMIAWMQNWGSVECQKPDLRCYGELTLPRELSIRDGRLVQNPVRELEQYRTNPVICRDLLLTEESGAEGVQVAGVQGRILDMTLTVRPDSEQGYHYFQVCVAQDGEHETSIRYEPERGSILLDRSRCAAPGEVEIIRTREFPVHRQGAEMKLRLLLDRHSLELFVNDGEEAASLLLYTPQTADGIRFVADGGAVRLDIEKYDIAV